MRLLALALSVSACGSTSLSLDSEVGGAEEDDYADVLEAWTRQVEVVPIRAGFDNVLSGDATYRSWAFRTAYARQYAQDHHYSRNYHQALVATERSAHEAAHEFFFSGYAADRRSLELESEESAWRLTLVSDARVRAEPIEVTRIRRPTATVRAYYPYATPTRMTFVIKFPRDVAGRPVLPPSAKWFSLHFDGPLGHAEMKWEIK